MFKYWNECEGKFNTFLTKFVMKYESWCNERNQRGVKIETCVFLGVKFEMEKAFLRRNQGGLIINYDMEKQEWVA